MHFAKFFYLFLSSVTLSLFMRRAGVSIGVDVVVIRCFVVSLYGRAERMVIFFNYSMNF